MKLVSMKMSEKEAKASSEPCAATAPDAPRYPYGLCLELDNESLDKLELDLPEVGTVLTLTAKVKVTRVSANDSEGGESRRSVALQITDLGLDTGKSSVKASDGKAAQVLFGEKA